MRRLLVIFNPRSSRFVDVKKEVIDKTKSLKGYMVGKYEIEPTSIEENVKKLSKILKDDDIVLAAGGDATGVIASNAILESKKDVALTVLPYGNFNDLARTLGVMKYENLKLEEYTSLKTIPVNSFYPLEIFIDGKFWRYATCYVTMGMTAEAVPLFDEPKTRKKLQKGHKSSWRSYLYLMKWYFLNRHKKVFIPEFTLNGELKHQKTSDYAAVNGRSMCRVMKGGDDYHVPKTFRSMTGRLTSFPRLFVLMAKSILVRTPGDETNGDTIEFKKPATVSLQAEGEYQTFENVKKIEIRKSEKCLKVIEN